MTENTSRGRGSLAEDREHRGCSEETKAEVAGHLAEARAANRKPTAGPWQAQHDWDMNGACTIIGNVDCDDGHYTYTTICDINEEPDEWLANRRLIIAAPEMLAALRQDILQFDTLCRLGVLTEQQCADCTQFARAALAKAEQPVAPRGKATSEHPSAEDGGA